VPSLHDEPKCEMLHNVAYTKSEDMLEMNGYFDYLYFTGSHKVGMISLIISYPQLVFYLQYLYALRKLEKV
jgi:hypothetical protein